MQIDEELKNLIPKLSEEELKQLEENIIKEGCREPIIIWNDTIIDGHNRYEICKRNNIEFKTINKEFLDKEEAKKWIIENQFGRRNLSLYDKSVLALKLENVVKKKAKENQVIAGNNFGKGCQISDNAIENKITPIDTKKEIAQIAGTSHDTIARVKKIEEKAPEEVKEKVKNGEMSINQAYGYVKTYEYLEEEIKDKEVQEQDNENLKEQFKEIERIKGTEIRMQEAIFKILTVEVNEENVQIWIDGLDDCMKDELVNELDEAIEKYKFIKEIWLKNNQIRRIK